MADDAKGNPDDNKKTPPDSSFPLGENRPEVPSNQEQPTSPAGKGNEVEKRSVLTWLTGGLLIFAAVQASVYYFTLRQIARQADAADRTIVVTKMAVKTAENTLAFQKQSDSNNRASQKRLTDSTISVSKEIARTQERFAKIDTRAYLVATTDSSSIQFMEGDSIQIRWDILNVGKTPARQVRMTVGVATENFSVDLQERRILPHITVVIGGNKPFTRFGAWHIDKQLLQGVNVGKQPLYFVIRITYNDVFGDIHSSYGQVKLQFPWIINMPAPIDN